MSRREVQMISDLPKKFQISVGMTLTVRRKFGDDRPVERIRDRFQDLETRKRLETELGGESGWIGRISFRIPSVLVKNVNAVLVCEGFVFILLFFSVPSSWILLKLGSLIQWSYNVKMLLCHKRRSGCLRRVGCWNRVTGTLPPRWCVPRSTDSRSK